MPSLTNKPGEGWPVTWEAVEEAQLRDWLKLTPAERLSLAEELLSLSQFAVREPTSTNTYGK